MWPRCGAFAQVETGMHNGHNTLAQRVLVAGGGDFLAPHLCRRLLGEGLEVYALDNFHGDTSKHLIDLKHGARLKLLRHDLVDPLRLDVKFGEIYYLACCASPGHFPADPVHTLRSCVDGAYHLLELAKHGGSRILLASSSEVYGDPHVHPQPEAYRGNVNPVGVHACYDEGIRCAEALFCDYARRKRVDAKIARVFNTYGPLMSANDGRVVPSFVTQALKGRNLTVYGNGTQIRSLCYVDDMVEGLLRLMRNPSGFNGPVNLGDPNEITVLDIARRVRALSGADVSLEFRPLPTGDTAQRCPDIFLARHHLHWEPHVSLDDGLRSTIDYFSGLIQSKQAHRAVTQGVT